MKGKYRGPCLGLQKSVCHGQEPFQWRVTYIGSICLCDKILPITRKIGRLSPRSFCGSGIHRLSQSSSQGCNLIAWVVWGMRPWFRCFLSYWLLHRPAWVSSWKLSQLSPEWREGIERKKREGENTNVFRVLIWEIIVYHLLHSWFIKTC